MCAIWDCSSIFGTVHVLNMNCAVVDVLQYCELCCKRHVVLNYELRLCSYTEYSCAVFRMNVTK